MVPAPTYKNLPVFGTSASLVVPIPETYTGGFLPGQVFPAEYENWLMNYITDNSLTSQTTAASLAAEVITVLTAAEITPVPASTTQLYSALNALYATVGALDSEASTRSQADLALQDSIDTLQNNIEAQSLVSPIAISEDISTNRTQNVTAFSSGALALVSVSIQNVGSDIDGYTFTLRTPSIGSSFTYSGLGITKTGTGVVDPVLVSATTKADGQNIFTITLFPSEILRMTLTMKRNS